MRVAKPTHSVTDMIDTQQSAFSSGSLALTLSRLRRLDGGEPTLHSIMERLGERSTPLMLVLLGLIAFVPSPGIPIGAVFGTITVIIAFQAFVLGKAVRLPQGLGSRRLPARLLDALARYGVPFIRRVERHSRQRLGWLLTGRRHLVLGLAIMLQAFLIALPIPFGNTLPAVAIIFMSAGMLWHDGFIVAAGLVTAMLATAVSVLLLVGAGYLLAGLAGSI